jgi:hypothetical protein
VDGFRFDVTAAVVVFFMIVSETATDVLGEKFASPA